MHDVAKHVCMNINFFILFISPPFTMAAKMVRKASATLSCPVCYQLFRNPKYLPCHHSYCEECLEKMQIGSKVTCPECRKEATVPPEGVKDFDNNFFITRMLDEFVLQQKIESEEDVTCDDCTREDPVEAYCSDCNLFLCSVCNAYHRRSTRSQGHNILSFTEVKSSKKNIPLKSNPKVPMCRDHSMELSFYCETCNQLVCVYCTMKDHVGHNHDTVKKKAIEPKKAIKNVTASLERIIRNLSDTCNNLDRVEKSIRAQGVDLANKIDQYYNKLVHKLTEQKELLKQQLHEIVSQKQKAVRMQLEEVEVAQVEASNIKELKDTLENGSDQETLIAKKQVIDRMQQLTAKFKQLKTKPVQLATMDLVPSKEPFPQFATLCSTAAPDPSSCEVSDLPGYTFVGKRTVFTVITRDDNGHHCSRGGSSMNVHLDEAQANDTVQVRDKNDGTYIVSFQAQKVGLLNVTVLVDEEEIKQSYVFIRKKPTSISSKPSKVIDNDGNMNELWGIAFSKDGSWAAADWSNHCVYLFNKNDKLLGNFGSQGTNKGQFDRPKGIAFDNDNHIYVADYNNHRVQKFTSNGTYMLQFSDADNQLKYPTSLSIYNDIAYVADSGNKCLSVFQTDGTFLDTLCKDMLGSPLEVEVCGNNWLLIPDGDHHCIHTVTMDGYYVGKFGSYGTGRGQLNYPYSVTTDVNGLIFVADTFNDRVVVFDKDGTCIHCFGSRGSGIGQFSCPYGIALSPNGSIYVSDHENKRIKIFADY